MTNTLRTTFLGCALAAVLTLPSFADTDPNFRPPAEESTLDSGPISVRALGATWAPTFIGGEETGFGMGLQILRPFHLGPDAVNTVSALRLLGLATFRGQARFESRADLYWGENRWYGRLDLDYDGLATPFYGIGNPAPRADAEYYEPDDIHLRGFLFRRLHRSLRAGLTGDFQHHVIHEPEAGGLIATDPELRRQDGTVSGLGLALGLDTRDRVFDPHRGVYATASVTVFDDVFGSEYDFKDNVVDLRGFMPLAASHVLAVQLHGKRSYGAPPFWRLPSLGELSHSRAYPAQRLCDRVLAAGLVEWRWRWSRTLGWATFASEAFIADRAVNLRLADAQPTLGAGLRIYEESDGEMVPTRLDVSWGREGWRLLIGVGDAF